MEKLSENSIENFFENYVGSNSVIILLYILFSLSFYIIYWLYITNKDLSEIDENAPDPNRAISVLLIIPSLFFLLSFILKKYIFHFSNSVLLGISWNFKYMNIDSNFEHFYGVIEFIIWVLIIMLILKYFFDFSISFAKVTKTEFIIWYVFLASEVFGFVFLLFGNYFFFIISFFTIIAIPAMQEKLNILAHKYQLKKEREIDLKYGSHA